MPYDLMGRPPAEISSTIDRDRVLIRPFEDFGPVGRANDSATIQAAIDWSASVNDTDGQALKAVGQPGDFRVDGLVIKHGTRLICPGRTATRFRPIAAPTASSLVKLDAGPVQKVTLAGFSIDMSDYPTQHAMYLKAVPVLIDGATQGGLWYFRFEDFWIQGCTAESLWFRGRGDAFDGPHQFGKVSGVVVESASTTRPALRLTGQVGQVDFDADCRFDGPGRGVGVHNILIQRTVDDSDVNNGDVMPYSIRLPVTSQSNSRIATVERGLNISFDEAHFEEANEGIYADVSAGLVRVNGAYFANIGNHSGAGWAVKSNSGHVIAGHNFFAGTTDKHYVRSSGGQLTLLGGDVDATGVRTDGVTLQINTAATISTGFFESVFVNGGSSTVITSITSDLAVGKFLTIRANGGLVIFGTGGNIDFGGGFPPFNLLSGTTATFVRNDLSGVWQLVGVSGPRGNYHPAPVFVNHAASPYQVLPGSGTIRCDTSAGDVRLKLPSISKSPPGERIAIVKLSSANTVFVNGFTTAENPNGFADDSNILSRVLEVVEFEHNDLGGFGAWDLVAHAGGPVSLLSINGHLTGGSYDGSAPVTIDTDATSANTASTLVARDASGNFAAGVITATGVIIGPSDPGGTATARVNGTGFFAGSVAISTSAGGRGLSIADSTSNTGIGLTPHASGDSAFVDVLRVGALAVFRVSNASSADRAWLTVVAAGSATFGFGVTVNAPLTVVTSTSSTGFDISDTAGNSGISITPHTSGDSAFIDNNRVGSGTIFRSSSSSARDRSWLTVTSAGNPTFSFGVTMSSNLTVNGSATFSAITSNLLPTNATYDLGGGSNKWKDYYGSGKIEIGTTIKTGAPSGGTSGAWKLGEYVAGTVSVDFAHYVEIDIGGALRKLATVT